MSAANYITFSANMPDDSVEDEAGEIIIPPGRNILDCLSTGLMPAATTVDPPTQYSFYGWETTFDLRGQTYWLLLQAAECWLMIVENRSNMISRLIGRGSNTDDMIKLIVNALSLDHRFSHIRVQTEDDYRDAARSV